MGRKIRMVQIISGLQTLLQNRRWANGIRVAYFPRIQYVAAQSRSQKFTVEIKWDTREFHRKNYFHVDVQRHLLCEKECESNGRLVSLYAKRFGTGQLSFLGLGSEKKWYSISADSPQGEWDRIADRMMLDFGESRHPVFRATRPLSRGQLKKQRPWKIVDPLLCRPGNDYNCFSHNYFCKSAQSLRGSRRNVWRIWILSCGKTRCGRTVEFLVRVECDQHKRAFEQWWSYT